MRELERGGCWERGRRGRRERRRETARQSESDGERVGERGEGEGEGEGRRDDGEGRGRGDRIKRATELHRDGGGQRGQRSRMAAEDQGDRVRKEAGGEAPTARDSDGERQ